MSRFISVPLNLARGQFLQIWNIVEGESYSHYNTAPYLLGCSGGRREEGERGGGGAGEQNEPRAIISMARQLRSSRGHLLLRARRPDDRSSFNNLPPRVPPREPLRLPSRVSIPDLSPSIFLPLFHPTALFSLSLSAPAAERSGVRLERVRLPWSASAVSLFFGLFSLVFLYFPSSLVGSLFILLLFECPFYSFNYVYSCTYLVFIFLLYYLLFYFYDVLLKKFPARI